MVDVKEGWRLYEYPIFSRKLKLTRGLAKFPISDSPLVCGQKLPMISSSDVIKHGLD